VDKGEVAQLLDGLLPADTDRNQKKLINTSRNIVAQLLGDTKLGKK